MTLLNSDGFPTSGFPLDGFPSPGFLSFGLSTLLPVVLAVGATGLWCHVHMVPTNFLVMGSTSMCLTAYPRASNSRMDSRMCSLPLFGSILSRSSILIRQKSVWEKMKASMPLASKLSFSFREMTWGSFWKSLRIGSLNMVCFMAKRNPPWCGRTRGREKFCS